MSHERCQALYIGMSLHPHRKLWGSFVIIPILQMKAVVVGKAAPAVSQQGPCDFGCVSSVLQAPRLWNEGNSTYLLGLPQNLPYLASGQHLVQNRHSCTAIVTTPTSQLGKDLSGESRAPGCLAPTLPFWLYHRLEKDLRDCVISSSFYGQGTWGPLWIVITHLAIRENLVSE